MTKTLSLKDALFNPKKVKQLSREIKHVYSTFKDQAFQTEVLQAFEKLKLKERITHIAVTLHAYLPAEYHDSIEVILNALPPELDLSLKDDDFGDFIYAPYGEFVMLYGCNEEHLDLSLHALEEITKRFSVEFAIRDFINAFPTQTLAMLERCARSENYHQRRLSSEGLRPRLPWAKNLTIDYKTPLKHLVLLYTDNTRFVTRSVANHLNDISKIDPSLVLETLKMWKSSNKQEKKEMAFIINHALRSLVKKGYPQALEFLGYKQNPNIHVSQFTLKEKKLKVGEALQFFFKIKAKEETMLMVDYTLFFVTKAGKLSPKVYKIKRLSLKRGDTIMIEKNHLFKANMTTRKLYTGKHKIEVQINGKVMSEGKFFLQV